MEVEEPVAMSCEERTASSCRRVGKLKEGIREAEGTLDALSEGGGPRNSELGGSSRQSAELSFCPSRHIRDTSGLGAGGKRPLGRQWRDRTSLKSVGLSPSLVLLSAR